MKKGPGSVYNKWNKGNNKITELRPTFQRKVKTHKYINRQNQSTTGKLKTVVTLIFLTQIFHNGPPSHGGDHKTFEVMTST